MGGAPPPIQPSTPGPHFYAQPPMPKSGLPAVAIVTIVLLVGFVVVVAILAAILLPVFSQARSAARQTVTLSNAKVVGLANLMYANDFDDRLCPTTDWNLALLAYYKQPQVLEDPTLGDGLDRRAIGLNPETDQVKQSSVVDPDGSVMLGLTTSSGKDAVASAQTLRALPGGRSRTIWVSISGVGRAQAMEVVKARQWHPTLRKQ